MDWNGSGYKSTNDSFLFSFSDRNNPQSANNVGYCNNSQYAVYCNSSCGPVFGYNHDLYRDNNGTWHCSPSSYSKIDLPTSFNSDDYEVFQIIRND